MDRLAGLASTGTALVAALVLTGCTGSGSLAASPSEPSEEDVNQAVEETIAELAAEGRVVDPSVWEDADLFRALIEGSEARLTGASTSTGAFQLGPEPATFQDALVVYCGKGQDTSYPFHPGSCLNEVCFQHDRCYDTIRDAGPLCLWSERTQACDARFFKGAEACAARDECGARCKLIRRVAQLSPNLCWAEVVLQTPACSAARAGECDHCTPKSCADLELDCGTYTEGCGGTQACGGECSAGRTCGGDGVANVCGPFGERAAGSACESSADCDRASACIDGACVGPDAPPDDPDPPPGPPGGASAEERCEWYCRRVQPRCSWSEVRIDVCVTECLYGDTCIRGCGPGCDPCSREARMACGLLSTCDC